MIPKAPVAVALIHHPVYNIRQEVVTTSITPFDLHDIARTAKTYGVSRYFVISPLGSQQALAHKILDHWRVGIGGELNKTRKEAFQLIELCSSLDDARLTIQNELGRPPRLVATSARGGPGRLSFGQCRAQLLESDEPHLLLFGTGWGMTEEILSQAHDFLEPIAGGGDGSYNHLPVRAAVAIILDRLLG